MAPELILRNAHVIDPAQDLSQIMDVHLRDGMIARTGLSLPLPAGATEKDFTGCYLCPGLIDLHGHWYEGSSFGINPEFCLEHGVTTVVDAGTTGFVNFPEFRASRIAKSRIQTLAFVNIAALGLPTSWIGELEDLRFARPQETVAVLEEHAEVAVGVKVRMRAGHSHDAFGLALEAATSSRKPLMVHIGPTARTSELLRRLRPGDIVTHCFEGRGDGIIENGSLLPETIQARKQGVVFDVGHGCGSFSWEMARKAFELSFYPDTISTDLHRYSVERWAVSMPAVMSKFLHLGMSIGDVVSKSTWMPAKVLQRAHQIGTLKPGTVADVFVFKLEEGEFPLEDTHLKLETATRRIKPVLVIKSGEISEAEPNPLALRKLQRLDLEVFRSVYESA